jgi:hypothetical protein
MLANRMSALAGGLNCRTSHPVPSTAHEYCARRNPISELAAGPGGGC